MRMEDIATIIAKVDVSLYIKCKLKFNIVLSHKNIEHGFKSFLMLDILDKLMVYR